MDGDTTQLPLQPHPAHVGLQLVTRRAQPQHARVGRVGGVELAALTRPPRGWPGGRRRSRGATRHAPQLLSRVLGIAQQERDLRTRALS